MLKYRNVFTFCGHSSAHPLLPILGKFGKTVDPWSMLTCHISFESVNCVTLGDEKPQLWANVDIWAGLLYSAPLTDEGQI